MGIRSFGKGTFKKPVLTGEQIGNKRIYRIHEGDLVFNNVFAWEKAIAVTKKEDHGHVGSHRFITYVPHENIATSEFLCHHFLGERGIEDIRAASPGSAGRNRTLGLKKLDKIKVPVPDYDEQARFAELAKRRTLKDDVLAHSKLFYCRKFIDWKYEQEYRLFVDNSCDERTIPDEALSGIIFGCRAEPDFKEQILAWNKHRATPLAIYYAVENFDSYGFKIVDEDGKEALF